ncbi:hypothetical protein PFISCL1PPCAC_13671, partial [Pristionchus fissidentatus]
DVISIWLHYFMQSFVSPLIGRQISNECCIFSTATMMCTWWAVASFSQRVSTERRTKALSCPRVQSSCLRGRRARSEFVTRSTSLPTASVPIIPTRTKR